MDEQLQRLRRQFSEGDISILPEIGKMECRLYGHRYVAMSLPSDHRWSTKWWAKVEVCERCLDARGLHKGQLLPAPPIFGFTLAGRNTRHALKKYFGNATTAACNNLLHGWDGRKHLSQCREPVTCKNCLRLIERNSTEYFTFSVSEARFASLHEIMAHASQKYYLHLIDLFPDAIGEENLLNT